MKLVNFLVFGNILIALVAGLLTLSFSDFIGLENKLLYGLMLFFGTLFIYNIQRMLRFKEISGSSSSRHQWIKKNKNIIYVLLFLSGVGSSVSFCFLVNNSIALSSLLFICLISIVYAFRIDKKKRTVRELPHIKIHIIALSWMILAFLWPILNSETPFTIELFLSCLAVYLYFIGITIPFDIRDLPYDLKHQKTVPQILGIKKSKVLAVLILVVSFLLLLYTYSDAIYNPFIYVAYSIQLVLVIKSKTESKELLFSGGIDGSIVFFALFWFFQ